MVYKKINILLWCNIAIEIIGLHRKMGPLIKWMSLLTLSARETRASSVLKKRFLILRKNSNSSD